jgi:hypothetical protein
MAKIIRFSLAGMCTNVKIASFRMVSWNKKVIVIVKVISLKGQKNTVLECLKN